MRVPIPLVFISVTLLGCGQDYSPATTRSTSTIAAKVVGQWSGTSQVVVQWAKQKQLPVRHDIADDGTVTGSVGDAKLVDGRLTADRGDIECSLHLARDYRVHAKLDGDVIAAEQIHRDSVDIVFDLSSDGTLVGGLSTSGSEFGGKEAMKLAAQKMVLKKR